MIDSITLAYLHVAGSLMGRTAAVPGRGPLATWRCTGIAQARQIWIGRGAFSLYKSAAHSVYLVNTGERGTPNQLVRAAL